MSAVLPHPSLTRVFRLEATVGEPLEFGDIAQGRRRIVPQTGGTFAGPELNGVLLPGSSADWQIILPDGTALGDIRHTLQTDDGDLLYVQSRGVRHGSADVLARLARGEDVDASEYTFRTSTQIETAAPRLEWLNKGVFISVGVASPAASSTRPTSSHDCGREDSKEDLMLILRQKMRAKRDKSDELMAALAEIITPARATEGVISLDIARVLLEPDAFIATAVYEDGAALERQESRPEVHKVMAMLPDSLVAPPERTIFDAAVNPTLV